MEKNEKDLGLDRRRIAADQPYEVGYFARKYELTRDEARDIIKRAGNSRSAANQMAIAHKAERN